jgi:hypothetical protein
LSEAGFSVLFMTIAFAPKPSGESGSPGRPVWALTGEEMVAELDVLHAESCRIQARRLALLAGLESLGYAKDIGARGTADLLSRRHRLDYHQVNRDLKLATALPKYTTVQQSLNRTVVEDTAEAGVHPAQAEAIVTALEHAPSTVPTEDLTVAETEMVTAAATLPPVDLRRLGREVLERLDPDGREPDENTARDQEALWLGRTYRGHGIRFKGFLANENAELFQTLIDTCSRPHKITDTEGRQHLDPRTKTRRQADALTQILHAAAANGATADLPAHGGIRPHIMVTIGLDDLIQAGRQHTGDLLFGDRLSASAMRMLACDAGIIPIVLGTGSQPLDVGREFRSVTPAIRTALIARDKGCVICGAPPGWCDAHHLVHWADGGSTSVDNTALVCKPDHRAIHQGTWRLTMTNGTVHVTGPHYKPLQAKRAPTERPPPTGH